MPRKANPHLMVLSCSGKHESATAVVAQRRACRLNICMASSSVRVEKNPWSSSLLTQDGSNEQMCLRMSASASRWAGAAICCSWYGQSSLADIAEHQLGTARVRLCEHHKLPSVCVLDVLDDGSKGAFGQLEQRAEDWCGDHQLGQARVRLCGSHHAEAFVGNAGITHDGA